MKTESLTGGIEGIVLDAVGTLIEPRPSVAEVYLAVAARQGVRLDSETVRARFRRHFRNDERDETRGPMVTDEAIELRRWRRIVAQVLPELPDPDQGFEELWAHFGRPDAWRCFPDVGPAIEALRASALPVVVGSNFDSRLRGVLRGLEPLSGLASTAVISSEVGFRKPHPSFYRAACARLGLDPARVLFVGDDPENDVAGAVRAGLTALRLDRSDAAPREAVRSLAELPLWLQDRARMIRLAGFAAESEPTGWGAEAPRADEGDGP